MREYFKNYNYPQNLIWAVTGDLHPSKDLVKRFSKENTKKYLEEAIAYIGADEQTLKYIDLRYKQHTTLTKISEKLQITKDQCRQIDIKLCRKLRGPSAFWIIEHGVSTLGDRLKVYKTIYDIPIAAIETIDSKVQGALRRTPICRGDSIVDWVRTLGDICELFASGDIVYVRGLGMKGINDTLIPAMKELGFTDEELTIKRE